MDICTFTHRAKPGAVVSIEYNRNGSWRVWHLIMLPSKEVIIREVDLTTDEYYPDGTIKLTEIKHAPIDYMEDNHGNS